jgi:hypothetical protein
LESEWVRHLKTPKEREDFLKYVRNSKGIIERLHQIVDGYVNELRNKEQNEDYSSPAWSHLQADRLGQLKSLVKIKRLLTFKGSIES